MDTIIQMAGTTDELAILFLGIVGGLGLRLALTIRLRNRRSGG